MATYAEIQKELENIRSSFINNLEDLEITDTSWETIETSPKEFIAPISDAGVVYKYDRGVIGIDQYGKKEEIDLDEFNISSGGHSLATLFIGCLLNKECKEKYESLPIMTPFESGKIISDYGIYIIQLEGDSMYVYNPETPTDIQKKALQEELDVRTNFKIEYIENTKKNQV